MLSGLWILIQMDTKVPCGEPQKWNKSLSIIDLTDVGVIPILGYCCQNYNLTTITDNEKNFRRSVLALFGES